MAPALTDTTPVAPHQLRAMSKAASTHNSRTSGQHPPLYSLLKQLEQFPIEISGATVWEAKDYANNPERWIHRFSQNEITELSKAADDFSASGIPLVGIAKVRTDTQTCHFRASYQVTCRTTFVFLECLVSLKLSEQSF